MDRWVGKVAVVTGTSSGIGADIARGLVEQGIKVVGLARRAERLQKLEADLKGKKGSFKGIKCDVTKEEDILNAFKWVENNLGAVHIMINNAGVLPVNSTGESTNEEFRKVFETNVIALNICTKEALKSMKAHDVNDGHIINMNSIAGHFLFPFKGVGPYSASKHAVTVLTEYLRSELGLMKKRIKVTSISPGLIESEMSAQFLDNIQLKDDFPVLPASAVTDAVVYVLSTPPKVNISELTIQPIGEVFEMKS